MIILNNINITQYVDITSVVTNDTIDETLASASFTIPFVSPTNIANGDQPIPRLSEVKIDDLLYVVSEDTVTLIRKGANPLYKHDVSLIEPTKILQKKVIPNLTITQPQGDATSYVFSVHRVNPANFTDGGFKVENTQLTVPTISQTASQDSTKIQGLQLKNTNPYIVRLEYTIENRQTESGIFGLENADPELDLEIQVFYGTTQIGTTKIENIPGKPFNLFGLGQNIIRYGGLSINLTPTTINQNISVKVRTLGMRTSQSQDTAYILEFSIIISQADVTLEKKLDFVVDKLLSFYPTFTLANETRAKIQLKRSPEFTFQNYTLYDALKEVANFESAIVYLGENDFTTIHFYYYDDPRIDQLEFIDLEKTEYLDGFVDGFEINAANVIRDDNTFYPIIEPGINNFLTVRSESEGRGEQIIDTSTAIHLQHGIYRPIEVIVKGLEFEMIENGNTITMAKSLQWNITEYVIENQRYNTFSSQITPNSRGQVKNKSNTVYYSQGDNKIYGLGFLGTVPPLYVQSQEPNYAIWEAIMCVAKETFPNRTFQTDYLVDLSVNSIHDIQMRIKHIPYSDVRLTLYKSKGDNVSYFNEQSSLNDMELLGRIGQENLNRSGNQTLKYKGFTANTSMILGSKHEDQVLVNYTISRTPTINKFVAEYAVGYSNISNYVGVDSAYRQYEVPQNTYVNRRDKTTSFLKITHVNTPPTPTPPEYMQHRTVEALFKNYTTTGSGTRPTYAHIRIDGGVRVVESTIDAYRMGKTIGLAIDMLDNYSAGIVKKDQTIYKGGNPPLLDVKVQEDARYTNDLGNFQTVTINYSERNTFTNPPISTADNYPNNDLFTSNLFFFKNYTVNKDARERYGFVWELAFIDGNVKIYDGFVKYNRIASEATPKTAINIRLLNKGYLPNRNLDETKTLLVDGTLTWINNYYRIRFTPPVANQYEGVIITLFNEPIIAIQTSDYDNITTEITKYLFVEDIQ